MEKEHLIKQLIISSLKNSYGIDVANLIFLPLGADVDALIYKAQAHDQTEYFVKLKRGQHDISVTLQLLLYDAGIKEIISPTKTLNGQPKLYIDAFTLIVYPFIDGQDGFSQNLTDNQWVILGKALKHIHQFQLPTSISELIKQESYSPEWRNNVRSLYEHNQHVASPDEITSKFLAALEKHKAVILSLVDRAEKLSYVIQKQSVDFVLCHSDIHAGNVLVAKNGALYIVDWDQPIMAPKERDLMFIGGGVGNVWNNQREVELFYTGYGKTEINKTIIDYYRCERIIEDVALYNQELLSVNRSLAEPRSHPSTQASPRLCRASRAFSPELDEGSGRTAARGELVEPYEQFRNKSNVEYKNRLTSYNHFVAMFEPNGVVDIALQTSI